MNNKNKVYENTLIIGAGSLSGWLALALAKQQMLKNVTIYDDDMISSYNHYNQVFFKEANPTISKAHVLHSLVRGNISRNYHIIDFTEKFTLSQFNTLSVYDLIIYGADTQTLLIEMFDYFGTNSSKAYIADFITAALSLDDNGNECGNFAYFNLLQDNYREAFKTAFCYSDDSALEHHPTSPCGGVQAHERPVEPLLYLTSNLVSLAKHKQSGLYNYYKQDNIYTSERLM